MAATTDLEIGVGIYSLPNASQILKRSDRKMSTRQVRSWARRGLTYGVHDTESGSGVLTFQDLVSLEVEGRLRRAGMTSQGVRQLEHRLRVAFPEWDHPLARGIFYITGRRVWATMDPSHPNILFEVLGKMRDQYVMSPMVKPFCRQVTFDEDDRRAIRWDLNDWVQIDPLIQFGAPIVKGTRTPVSTIAANLRAGTAEQVADWYDLTLEQILGVKDYLSSVA